MPKYKVKGSVYDIPDDKVGAFETRYPDAVVDIYDNDGAAYSLPLDKRDAFQKKFDKWSYNTPATAEAAAVAEHPLAHTEQRTVVPATPAAPAQELQRPTDQVTVPSLPPQQAAQPTVKPEPASRQSANMTASEQLRKANSRLQELQAKAEERKSAISAKWEAEFGEKYDPKKGVWNSVKSALQDALLHTAARPSLPEVTARIQSDSEYRALQAAIHQTESQIGTLKDQHNRDNGVDVGFWRGFGATVSNGRTWDFGYSSLMDMTTMMQATDPKSERFKSEGAKEAEQEMMQSAFDKQQAAAEFGDNEGFWHKAGVMTGHMPAFMIDFAATGGGYAGIKILGKGGAKLATKAVTKEVVEEIAKQGVKTYVKNNGVKGLGQAAANWTIKAVGTTADDLLIRAPLMANTMQSGKTAADVIGRKLGDVAENEDGSLGFENDRTWGNAIWQGEANAIVENYSEMFGTHLDPVLSLRNMGKLANTIGAKRLGGVLAKADAGALGPIMGQTQKLFNKMGVNDYVGEVTEEYYGQLWRTMLNLDDAYQGNPDGTRTNLLATGQFHGDIWGGMALSMGLMGAVKHSLSAVSYASTKHGVNKADARASEALGADTWEPLRASIDLTTNEDIGALAESLANDDEMTADEKTAVLGYMERSMYLRGLNLGTLAQTRGAEQNKIKQEANDSYLDGYNIDSPQEMNDAKNMYDYQRQRAEQALSPEVVEAIDSDPMGAFDNIGDDADANQSIIDYINTKLVYDGLLQRVRDDIDGRIDQSNAMIDARVNRSTGVIQGATMKLDDRKVYVMDGNLVMFDDGRGIDHSKSSPSVVIRDAETGKVEMVSPEAVLGVDEAQLPDEQKEVSAQALRQQFAQEAASKIDGTVAFNPGDTYTITDDQGQQAQIQIVSNEHGVADNGDGTVNVTSDGSTIVSMSKEDIQSMVDATNIGRVAEFEQQRAIENVAIAQAEQETARPQYILNDILALRDKNGAPVRGSVTADVDADGRYEVYTEEPINGKRVNLFSREELDNMLTELNGEAVPSASEKMASVATVIAPEAQQSALERIPNDEQGQPIYEQANAVTAWDAIVEQASGNESIAQTVADEMVADKQAELKKIEKAKPKGGTTVSEKIAAEKERQTAIDNAKALLAHWKTIAATASSRQAEIEAERRRKAEAAAALLKEQQEVERVAHEEAERIKRETLNGVPDFIDDTPQNARARGYRRVTGDKVDRQEPIAAIHGKKVQVKFDDNVIPAGRVALIESDQIQPSHIQGRRNPKHFIDEAQPKERNDQASIMSARKIAGSIRPEEITSSVTAYTGAPTINARGEAIQGNNRSDALRLMWEQQAEQAAKYKQYLMDRAEEFGLTAEDIDKMEKPVIVNMLDVDDDTAISLGQYVAQDTESGGTERIKPQNAIQRMGANMRSFANLLLRAADDETSFAGLVDRNGADVLEWMNQKGFITPTQYKSAFDSKGYVAAEAKNDLKGIMFQSIFQGGSTQMEEMFNALPTKAQKAILATAFRDYDSPNAERMIEEIQNSIRAFYALSRIKEFAETKNYTDARLATEAWKRQYQMDDVTGEGYLPAEKISNFALCLAIMYKGESQARIQGTFNALYDLIQGTQEETLFDKPDNTPRSLAQAIKKTLNIDYNGQRRSDVLAGDTSAGQQGEQGSDGSIKPGERVEDDGRIANDSGRTESGSGQSEVEDIFAKAARIAANDAQRRSIAKAEAQTDTNSTDAQKEAGNYKKGHIDIDGHKITIENPKGSTRSGIDADGNPWSVTMNNTYGYICGTQGVDGDHIDVFLSEHTAEGDIFVVDQVNADGSFDEHKVMYGFKSAIQAKRSYLKNYSPGWKGCGSITRATREEFKKWIGSSHRKTKPFAEYKSVSAVKEATKNTIFAAKTNHDRGYETAESGRNNDGRWQADGGRISTNAAGMDPVTSGRGDIRVFEEGMAAEHYDHSEHSERDRREAESQRLVEVAKQSGLYIDQQEFGRFGTKYPKRTGESVVYIDEPNGKVYKVKNPYAKSAIKGGHPEDAIYEHIVHNLLFPETWYAFEGIGEHLGDARIILSQAVVESTEQPTQAQIDAALAEHGLLPEDKYTYGNDLVSVTDVEGDNALLGYDGRVYFIDPIIKLKKSAREVMDVLSEQGKIDLTENNKLDHDEPISIDDIRKVSDAFAEAEAISPEDVSGHPTAKEAQGTLSDKQYGADNTIVTRERYEELRKRLHSKLGRLNAGIDPELMSIGLEMATFHIESGARKFVDYATAMVADMGDIIRPYLKAFYNGARDLPQTEESGAAAEMTPYDEVRTFDVANFDKGHSDAMATSEMVVQEQQAQKQAEKATQTIVSQRNTTRINRKSKKKEVSSQVGTPDLFEGPTNGDDVKNDIDGQEVHIQDGSGASERNGGHQSEQNKPLGEGAEHQPEIPDGRGVDRRDTEHSRDDTRRSNGVPRLSEGAESVEPSERKNTNNNHSERGSNYAPTSVDARIDANIKAIELAQQLIEGGDQATPEQMAVLRKFSGWGGLGKAFQDPPSYRGYGNVELTYSERLQQLLGEDAYQQAVMSANSSYYTPAYVVDTLWDIATQMGFKGGNILEGSAGIGNVLGQMPAAISERSDIHAIEIDSTSGGILSLLYPDAKVDVQGFEQTRIQNGSVDLSITNVPFVTGLRVNDTTGDSDLSKKFHNIHDFCIAKNVRKLREGGIGIFISSNGTLDSSKKLRDWIVSEGLSDVLGAFRMHNKTFGGTSVTSDIIVIRKRVNGRKSPNAIDVSIVSGVRAAEYDTGETKKVKGSIVPIVKQLSMDYNRYFIEHPEMMSGEMRFAFEEGDTFRPTSKGLYPVNGKSQEHLLSNFIKSFSNMQEEAQDERKADAAPKVYEDLGDDVKEGSMLFDKQGQLCVAQYGNAIPLEVNANKVKGHTKIECFNAYSAIKKAVADVLAYQTENEGNEGLQTLLDNLNKTYDDFVATYGHFNKNTAIAFLRNDVDFPNVFSLETIEETGDKSGNRILKYGKTDIFRQRVIEKEKELTPTNIKDGIIASVFTYGRIDVPYIAKQLDKRAEDVKHEIIDRGLGFEDPINRQMEVSYKYLSGNVREKLRQAQENNENGEYDANIKALTDILPMTIPAHLIDFTLGSSWIGPTLYNDYVNDRTGIKVKFTAAGGTWFMSAPEWGLEKEKNRAMGVRSEMFHKNILGHTLIEAAAQNRTITVSQTSKKWNGETETITDKDATQACAAKIDEIRQDFKDWARQRMQSDAEMSAQMERIYNDQFNNYVPVSIPDEFVPEHFSGAVTQLGGKPFSLRSHQGKAVVRGTMQPLLLAHEVGTGKTFTLISTAMEMRRLGTANKPMIVVQNATVGQFVASAKALYPNAKILTLEDADRSAEGRKNFYAKIRYNDWDMIVVPQSTFEFIPDSEERQMAFIQGKIEEKILVLEQMRDADPNGRSILTRQAEKEIEQLEEQLAVLSSNTSKRRTASDGKKRAVTLQNAEVKAREMLDRRTDDTENFDDMGIDALLIDEAHEYKHLGFATAMQRGVKGVDPSYSKKSQGVYLKTQAVLENNNGRNVVFATGTPISNTAAEIWTFMRYLMPADTMKEYDIYYFDDFVRNFGNIQQMLEFSTSGKFKENNRFAGYVNLPELVRIWSGVADTVLTKEAGEVQDKIPEIEGDKAQDLYLPQTRALRSIMKYVKTKLNEYDKMSGKEKKANSYIPLVMYGIAKAAAVDARLVQANAEDDPQSKTNEAVRQTLRTLNETADYNGTIAIFADNYQNNASGFNLYEDIRAKLIAEGVPADEIVVMKSGMSVKKKLEIFDKVNRGEVRVVIGSTFTLGTGVNIQERLHTLIHLDAPNRPMDYTQRNGRILRQGNLHREMGKTVRIIRFGVEDSLDVTAYQRLRTKGAIADSIMNGNEMMQNSMTNRVLEEEEDVFGDTVAQLSGSEYAMLKNQAEKNVRKFDSRRKQWEADQTYIHNAKFRLKGQIAASERMAKESRRYLQAVQTAFSDGKFNEIVVGKHRFASAEDMADFIKDYNKSIHEEEEKMRGNAGTAMQTRNLTVSIGDLNFEIKTEIGTETSTKGATLFSKTTRKMTYSCPELGLEDVSVKQSLLRNAIEDITTNVITGSDFAEQVEAAERSTQHNKAELEQLLSREGKPFEYEAELAQAKQQLKEYSEAMKKEIAEKEAKYAEMDATVEIVDDIENSEDDELNRDGTYTDKDVSDDNDPIAMSEQVIDLSKKLHLHNVEIITDANQLEGKKTKAKGFYSKSTGKITIVIPNHTSAADAVQTLLHEAVAHHGLREMFGEHIDTFLDNVFRNTDEKVRGRIVQLATRNGWDFRKATEEYLAGLAENTNFDSANNSGWWSKIKEFFIDMLHKMGFENFAGLTLTDNELRYILWRSYENLSEPGARRSLFGEAADIAKQRELKVGEYAEQAVAIKKAAKNSDDRLYRDGDPVIRERALARDRYELRVSRGMYQSQEALQDSMLGLKEAMFAILKAEGTDKYIEDVDGFENAYLAENRLSSLNKAEADAFAHTLFKPMLDEVAKLAPSEARRLGLTDYMMAKHGLERNVKMAERDAQAKIDAGSNDLFEDLLYEYRQRDYAGLTALTGFDYVVAAEEEAQRMVEVYEEMYDTAALWENVKTVSDAILEKSYQSGMMSKKTYEKVQAMYEFYIPLRGFDEKTSGEAYAYLSHRQSAFNAPIKAAQGRKSKADDPFATFQSMAESAIMQGNRNKLVKQRFLNFALNHPSDLVSVSDLWVGYDTTSDEWKPVFPDNIEETDTPDEVEQKIIDFERKMEHLAEDEPFSYKRGKDAENIPYRIVESRDLRQHQMVVKRGGRDFVVTINGNPRAVQALNGQTNPDNDMSGAIGAILRAGEIVNRQLSAFYTTRNPDFIVSNFIRDMLYSNTIAWIKESPNYALRFNRNFGIANPVTMKKLLAKDRKGELDMDVPLERMFHQFMMNGGETGYANIRDIEQHKNDIRRDLKRANGQLKVGHALSLLAERFDEYNRAVENCARFAAFVTSREMGRSIDRAIYDAKEISVNFNKKGSGAKFMGSTGQTTAGNASAFISGLGRSGYVFWNAAIQGTTNYGRQFKRHPAKVFAGTAVMFLLGAIVAALGNDGDDDDDKNAYYNLPEYVRRSNILFRVSDQWISIPLPIEYRAIYGMGELMTSTLSGKEHLTGGEIAEAIAGQMSQVMPIDFMEGGGGWNTFIPSSIKPFAEAYVFEKGWTGMPLYKNTPFNKEMPEWTKAYKSANKYLVGLANVLNEVTGGDRYTKGAIDLNPAKIEYVLNGYFGGVSGTIDKFAKTAETIAGQREYDPRSFLLLNRLIKNGDESTEYRAVNNEYYRLKEEHDQLKTRLKHYEEDTDNGILDYAEKIDFLYNSPEYERYEIYEDYRGDIDALYKEMKDVVNDEDRKDIEAELNELKKEMISEMNLTRKRK